MFRPISRLTGGALAATGATLAIATVASVIVLSSPGSADAGTPGSPARSQQQPAVSASASTTISLRTTKLGRILVASNGHTLYAFSRDGRNQDRCAKVSGCTRVWPIAAAHGKPKAGSGVSSSLLGTITIGHVSQVTYAGHPLYTYSADSGPGDTSYVGVSQFGGTWAALTGTGRLVK